MKKNKKSKQPHNCDWCKYKFSTNKQGKPTHCEVWLNKYRNTMPQNVDCYVPNVLAKTF